MMVSFHILSILFLINHPLIWRYIGVVCLSQSYWRNISVFACTERRTQGVVLDRTPVNQSASQWFSCYSIWKTCEERINESRVVFKSLTPNVRFYREAGATFGSSDSFSWTESKRCQVVTCPYTEKLGATVSSVLAFRRKPSILIKVFCGFFECRQANSGIIPPIKPTPLPSTSFPINHIINRRYIHHLNYWRRRLMYNSNNSYTLPNGRYNLISWKSIDK